MAAKKSSKAKLADDILQSLQNQNRPASPRPKKQKPQEITPETEIDLGALRYDDEHRHQLPQIQTAGITPGTREHVPELLDAANIPDESPKPIDPLKKWHQPKGWCPSITEYQMFLRWSAGCQAIQIATDENLNPERYGLPEVCKIIRAVESWYQTNYPEVHRQIKLKALSVFEAVSAMAMEGYLRSLQPKIETIVDANGFLTVKKTARDGDAGFLKLIVDVQERVLKLCSEITPDKDENQLIPSGLGRPREEVAREYLANVSKKLGFNAKIEPQQQQNQPLN